MEGAPEGFEVDDLISNIEGLAGHGDKIEITDFHLWQISQGKMALSAHINTTIQPRKVLKEI